MTSIYGGRLKNKKKEKRFAKKMREKLNYELYHFSEKGLEKGTSFKKMIFVYSEMPFPFAERLFRINICFSGRDPTEIFSQFSRCKIFFFRHEDLISNTPSYPILHNLPLIDSLPVFDDATFFSYIRDIIINLGFSSDFSDLQYTNLEKNTTFKYHIFSVSKYTRYELKHLLWSYNSTFSLKNANIDTTIFYEIANMPGLAENRKEFLLKLSGDFFSDYFVVSCRVFFTLEGKIWRAQSFVGNDGGFTAEFYRKIRSYENFKNISDYGQGLASGLFINIIRNDIEDEEIEKGKLKAHLGIEETDHLYQINFVDKKRIFYLE